jgi:hypothetical protein
MLKVEIKGRDQAKLSNRFAALEDILDNNVDISRDGESIPRNIKCSITGCIGCYELKQHKEWFDD